MKCQACGRDAKGVNHNGRGPRCEYCWALLPPPAQVRLVAQTRGDGG